MAAEEEFPGLLRLHLATALLLAMMDKPEQSLWRGHGTKCQVDAAAAGAWRCGSAALPSSRGERDAVAVVRMEVATGDVPQNVNYAVKSAYIKPLLEGAGVRFAIPRDAAGAKTLETAVEQVMDSIVLVAAFE